MLSYLIHDTDRLDRDQYVIEAARRLDGLVIVPAFRQPEGLSGCTMSHQHIVGLAKEAGAPIVCILEDDVKFTGAFSRDKWFTLTEWFATSAFSVLSTGVSGHSTATMCSDELVEVTHFSGTQMVVIKSDIYDRVLGASTSEHIDGIYSSIKCRKVVTVPFLTTQHPGHSAIRSRVVDDAALFAKQEQELLQCLTLYRGYRS